MSTKKSKTTLKKKAAGIKKSKRGALKEKILGYLRTAGDKGVTVVSLVPKLGRDRRKIAKWFYLTGPNVPGLKRVGPGKYKLAKSAKAKK
jgi:hypothetical protein